MKSGVEYQVELQSTNEAFEKGLRASAELWRRQQAESGSGGSVVS